MSTTFARTINNNPIYSARADADAAGNDIAQTYATKSELPSGVPSVTSSDDSKVLKATYSGGVGSYSWEAESGGTVTDVEVNGSSVVSGGVASITIPSQEQADWTESDTADPAYIQNKPDLVDIVAGPGIVVDNPDGNTLRVSVAQAEEVVLYDAGNSPSQAGPWQISEARTNFEWLDIVFGNDSTGSMKQVTRFAADSTYMKLYLPRYDEEPSYKWATMTLAWNNTTASIKTNSVGRFTIASNGSVSVSTAAAQAPYLFQIVGIHRIANN